MTNLFNGLKSLILRPKLIKIIFLIIIIVFMFNVYNILQTEKNPVYYFCFYLVIPAYLYILGMINQEKEEKISVKENSLPIAQENNIPVDDFNDQNDIDKLEKRIIKTSRTEEIETIYFRGGQAYRNKETYYFNNREGN